MTSSQAQAQSTVNAVKQPFLLHYYFIVLVGTSCLALGGLGLTGALMQWENPVDLEVLIIPDSALALVLFGWALLSRLHGASGWSRAATLLLLALGSHGVVQGLASGERPLTGALFGDYTAPGIYMTVLFMLQAAGLLIRGRQSFVIGLLLTVAGTVFLVSSWLPQRLLPLDFSHPFSHHQASIIASIYVAASGLALSLLPRIRPPHGSIPERLPLIAGALGVLLTCSGWLLLSQQNLHGLAARSELKLAEAGSHIEHAFKDHIQLLERQAYRWMAVSELPSVELWQQETTSYLDHFPAFGLLGVFNHRLQPVLLAARHDNADDWLDVVLDASIRPAWLEGFPHSDGVRISPLLNDSNGHVMLLALPLSVAPDEHYWLMASLDISVLLAQSHPDYGNRFSFEIHQGNELLHAFGQNTNTTELLPIGETRVSLPNGGNWELSSHLDARYLKQTATLPTLMFASGLLFSYLLMASLGLFRLAERRRLSLRHSHRSVQDVLQQRDQFFTLSLELFCRVSLDGRFLQVNPVFEKLLGYSSEQLLGEHFGILIRKDDHGDINAAIELLKRGQTIHELEARVLDCKGREYWVEINAALGKERVIYVVARNITGRKHTEETLLQNQRLFHIVGETALIGGWYIDLPEGRAVWSREVSAIHDEPADFQPTLEQAIDYYPPSCRRRLRQRLNDCMASGKPFDEDFELVTGHGREIVVRVVGHALYDDSGGIVQIQGSTQDITEQKQLRQEVTRLADRLTRTLENITVAFFTLDSDWRFSYVNGEAERLLEARRDALLGRVIWDVYPEALGTHFESRYRHAVDHGEPVVFEERNPKLGIWFEVHAHPSEEGLAVYFQNINARKTAERQLRILERSVESSVNGITIVDANQPGLPVIYINPAFEAITGYGRDDILGRNCHLLQGKETAQSACDAIRSGIEAQRDVHVVIRNYRQDGTPFWNELYISPVRDEIGVVTHFIGVQNDITAQREHQSQLAYSATHDTLTGLPNRTALEERIVAGCQDPVQEGQILAVLLIDLDGFKPINNTLGHPVGDRILVEVARRLERRLRPGDSVGRFGGDEFVMVLPNLTQVEATLPIIEQLLDEVAKPYFVDDNELYLTASIGVSYFAEDNAQPQPQRLIQQADLAMHLAKQRGHNTYQFFSLDLDEQVNRHVALRTELHRALEEKQFELFYQPQVHGPSGKILGFEALLRWKHPERGYVSPANFIEVAENTGQIIPISDWVLATACRDNQRLNELGHGPLTMAVNVSALQFQRNCFVADLLRVLKSTGLDASLLELELTENILQGDTQGAIDILHEIRKHGISIAIDDFGTGFSSLSYLKYLPIHKIKIDRSFIKEIISDHRDAAITQGMASIATQLDLQVVAEGVETEAQYAYLRKHLCENFQGFYFARPMPLEELIVFMNEHHQTQSLDRKRQDGEQGGQTLLLLDDEANILRALKRVLRRDGYRILTTTSAKEAFELLATEEVQVIVSDQRMPEMSGTEFLSRAKELYPETVQIVLSGYTDLKTVTEAINESAIYKFLTKPWDDGELRLVVQQAFRQSARQMVRKNR